MGCPVSRNNDQPALLPILSRGKHRNPRKGACFMEFASLLAGERWSDHPACTHPLLAAVARHVNDSTSDAGRSQLVELIPSVIGLTGDDLRIDAGIALGSARLALPVAAADRQQVLAELDGRPVGGLEEQRRSALAKAPHAARWAEHFIGAAHTAATSPKRFCRHAAPVIVHDAAQRIAQACVPDPDAMLRDLLVQAIEECRTWAGRDPNRDAVLTEPCGWPRAGAPEGSGSRTRPSRTRWPTLMAP